MPLDLLSLKRSSPLCPNLPEPFSFIETPKFVPKVSGTNIAPQTHVQEATLCLNQVILASEVQGCGPAGNSISAFPGMPCDAGLCRVLCPPRQVGGSPPSLGPTDLSSNALFWPPQPLQEDCVTSEFYLGTRTWSAAESRLP